MSKYKIDDKMRVRKDLRYNVYYNNVDIADEMLDFANTVVTITSIVHIQIYGADGNIHFEDIYRIQEDGGEWNWTESMFDDTHGGKCLDCYCYNTCNKAKCKYGH